MSNNGRKIYNSERERRKKQRQIRGFLSLVFSITIVFGIGILGFNIAKPVINYFSNDDDSSKAEIAETTEPAYTYEVLTDEPDAPDETDTSETEKKTDETEEKTETEISGSDETLNGDETGGTTISDLSVKESDKTVSSTTKPVPENNSNENAVTTSVTEIYSSLEPDYDVETQVTNQINTVSHNSSYHLTTEDMESMSNFKSSLSIAAHQAGCTYVIVPLKQTGGEIYYASSVEGARGCGAVKSDLTLSDIVNAIKEKGLTPIAEVSTLYDNLYSQVYTVASYKFQEDGTTSWWDNSQEKGGKPWLSPYSDYSKQYLASLAAEISAAGFTEIICTDFVFPPFRDSDVELLGNYVVEKDRYKALLSVAYAMHDAVNENTKLSVSFSAYDAIKGSAEVLSPSEMDGLSVTPVIDMTSFGSSVTTYKGDKFDLSGSTFNKAVGIIEALESVCGGLDMTPCFKRSSLSDDDVQQIMKAASALGYDCYFN